LLYDVQPCKFIIAVWPQT